MFKKVYFAKIGPNFVGSTLFKLKIYQRNTFRQTSIWFCIPESETPQPVLPYCKAEEGLGTL